MPPRRFGIAGRVRTDLAKLPPEEQEIALLLIDELRQRPINPDLGTHLSLSRRGVYVLYHVVAEEEIHVTHVGRHVRGIM